MDKETLSKYGWVVIVIIVLVILMSFAAPFGNYFSNSTMAILDSLTNAMAGEAGFVDADKIFSEHFGSINNSNSSATTSYTLEEIEADEHLYAIGKTQPEYVVAEFNDDYTEVVITKNGDESDGLMMDWADMTTGNVQISPMVENVATLQTAVIEEGVASVGGAAFLGMSPDFSERKTFLTSVVFPNSLQTIGAMAFYYCDKLVDMKLPENLTNIEESAFAYCESLKSVVIPKGVTVINREAFGDCSSLEEVTLHDEITRIENHAFNYCDNLKTITIPSSVIFIGVDSFAQATGKETTFYGVTGSYIETWATNKGYAFVAI